MEVSGVDEAVSGSVATETTFNQPHNHILNAPIAHLPTMNTMTIAGGMPVIGGIPVANMVPAAPVTNNMATGGAPIHPPTATASAVPGSVSMPAVMAMQAAILAQPGTAATLPVASPTRITAVSSMTALGSVTAVTGLPAGAALPTNAGTAVVGVKPTGSTSLTTLPSQATAIGALRQKVMPASLPSDKVLDKQRVDELVKEIDPLEQLDEDVEEMLLQVADDFIDTVVGASCQLAKHRKSNTVEAKDVQIHLERKWNMWIAGFGSDEVRPYKKATTTEAHRQRMALIKKTLKKY